MTTDNNKEIEEIVKEAKSCNVLAKDPYGARENWLRNTLTAYADQRVGEVLKKLKNWACSECDGSGSYSTPSDHSPCSDCDGTGIYMDGSFNDLLEEITHQDNE